MTRPAGLFGRLALAMLGPRPAEGKLATLAKSQPDPLAVVPVGKTGWKLGLAFFGAFCVLLVIFAIALGPMKAWIWKMLLVPILAYLGFFTWLQILLIAACRQPPLILEAEGLRINFTGDFVRYDQIAQIRYAYNNWASLGLKLVPGVTLKFGRAPYRLGVATGGHLIFYGVYSFALDELAEEIWRRKKVLGVVHPDEIDPSVEASTIRWW